MQRHRQRSPPGRWHDTNRRRLRRVPGGRHHHRHALQVIGQQSVNNLPLNGRNATVLTTLVAKSFFFTERVALQLRGEYFNILNHTNFTDPNTGYTTTFGRITGANDPRIAQLSGKLSF